MSQLHIFIHETQFTSKSQFFTITLMLELGAMSLPHVDVLAGAASLPANFGLPNVNGM